MKEPTLNTLRSMAESGVPLTDEWLNAIEELERGNTGPFFKLPSHEWQTLEGAIPRVAELLKKHAPRR